MSPDTWLQCKLADACSSIDYGFTASAKEMPVGPRFLRITDIVGGHIDWTNVPYVQADTETLKKYRLNDGDIVLARTGASTGASAYIKNPPDAIFASYLVRLKAKDDFNPRFIAYYLKSDDFWAYIRGVLGDKSAQPNASASTMTQAPLRVPREKKEQEIIAHILGTLDDKIELSRKMNQTLEAMARAIFKAWFVDFDPVLAKAERRDPGIPPDLAALFPDSFEDSELGEIPKGWRVTELGQVISELETGGRPKGGVSGITQGIPSIGAESIVSLGVFDYSKTKYVPLEFYKTMTKGHIKNRDVLLYKDGGRPGEFEPHISLFGDGFPFDTCSINEHVYRIRASQRLGQVFLYFWLSNDRTMDEMRIKGTGVAIPGLNSTQVKTLTTLVPDSKIIERFEALAGPFIGRIFLNCNESRRLASVRDALLPKLLSGEINVKDAEKFVESKS